MLCSLVGLTWENAVLLVQGRALVSGARARTRANHATILIRRDGVAVQTRYLLDHLRYLLDHFPLLQRAKSLNTSFDADLLFFPKLLRRRSRTSYPCLGIQIASRQLELHRQESPTAEHPRPVKDQASLFLLVMEGRRFLPSFLLC